MFGRTQRNGSSVATPAGLTAPRLPNFDFENEAARFTSPRMAPRPNVRPDMRPDMRPGTQTRRAHDAVPTCFSGLSIAAICKPRPKLSDLPIQPIHVQPHAPVLPAIPALSANFTATCLHDAEAAVQAAFAGPTEQNAKPLPAIAATAPSREPGVSDGKRAVRFVAKKIRAALSKPHPAPPPPPTGTTTRTSVPNKALPPLPPLLPPKSVTTARQSVSPLAMSPTNSPALTAPERPFIMHQNSSSSSGSRFTEHFDDDFRDLPVGHHLETGFEQGSVLNAQPPVPPSMQYNAATSQEPARTPPPLVPMRAPSPELRGLGISNGEHPLNDISNLPPLRSQWSRDTLSIEAEQGFGRKLWRKLGSPHLSPVLSVRSARMG